MDHNARLAAAVAAVRSHRDHHVALALSHFCPVAEFPATLGVDRAPLTHHGLIGEKGLITEFGKEVWAVVKEETP